MSAQGIDYAAATDQRGLVLAILQSGRSLTREEALQKFHIWNLPTRVCELRKAGYNIQSETVGCGGVRPVAATIWAILSPSCAPSSTVSPMN
ncbi:MAG: helix-turn-helix domain-containing protein [Pyramidobacter sp.]|uniref:helix-turn-helix domain-containing protein n=1 Tax=Pyramidobacter sp. TaxID=1943581 RepID=UPI002A80C323|nr:helix-turn-helix domain-containing protein [Pyramidobacter sp.]MDY4032592.1 helix-turn-helix domain-containing protein [Pyramidobacter sp.]